MDNPAIAIPNLLYTYADHIDDGRFDRAAQMFAHGCVVVYGKEIRGADELEKMFASFIRLYEDGTPKTRHVTSNPIIELADEGQSAACRSLWTLLQCTETLPLQVIGGGRYHDNFAVIDGAWHFTRREYARVDFWGNPSQHLLGSVEGWEA